MTDILSEQVPSYDILEVAPQVVVGGGGTWGSITGTLSDQTDLNTALGGKAATVHVHATSDVTGLDTALGLLAPKSAPTFTTSATFSFLTTGRVPYATTGGSVIDSANFTYNGTNLTIQSAVAATSTDGLVLATDQVATVGNQKWSPAIHLKGSGWKTNATAGAQSCDWKMEVQPIQNAASPSSCFVLSGSVNGSSYVQFMGIDWYQGWMYLQPSGSTNLMGVSGGAIRYYGLTYNQFVMVNSIRLGWNQSATDAGGSCDAYFMREAAANIRMGDVASASPIAQTFSVQDGSGTNIAGQNWTLRASRATGNAAGGKILFQTSDVGSTGATLQTATTKFEVGAAGVGFNGTAGIAKPTVTGSRGGNAALASLLTALANYGLITDSTSA